MRAADGKVDAMPGRELARDLIAGISTTDDNHGSPWKVTWQSVVGRVDLKDVGDEPRGQLGDGRRLQRAGGDHDLVSRDRPHRARVQTCRVPPSVTGRDGAVELDRESERLSVVLEIGHDFVVRRVSVCVAWERHPREAVVASRRWRDGASPGARARRRRRSRRGRGSRTLGAVARNVVAEREARLPGADHTDIELCSRAIVRHFGTPARRR